MKHLALIPLAALALSGCVTLDPDNDGISRARFGETAKIGDVRISPLKLEEDSRCPKDVQCVWAGQVRIAAVVTWQARVQRIELTQGKPVAVADGTLTLIEVTPDTRSNVAINPRDYRFGFRFTRGY
jgi:hypothetical protein